ncbi:MAG TPA: NAD(P)H-hydrate dehydratase [Thermomicrobiaceae bacterium]|nr:NAD(P)H-hydrate dehydratase [Thermomicrobiaceae bacterium]
MIKLCSVDEIRAAEAAAIKSGVSESELMLAAGQGVARFILENDGTEEGQVLFLVGPGKNGGDGLVAAAHLVAHGWRALIWGFKRTDVSRAPVDAELADAFEWIDDDALAEACQEADVIVDAVFGFGSRPSLPDEVAAAFQLAWRARVISQTPLVAIDVPSGIDSDTGEAAEGAFRADHTVTIGLPKQGIYQQPASEFAGLIHLLDIGLPSPDAGDGDAALISESDVAGWLARRTSATQKRDAGALMVIGGAPNYYGAPRMAAGAGARAGAGIVTLAVPRTLIGPISTALPEATYLPLPEGEAGGAGVRMASLVRERLSGFQAFVLGPGLGQDSPVPEFLSALLGNRTSVTSIGFGATPNGLKSERLHHRGVIDADGLNWLAKQDNWWSWLQDSELVLTPHPGELGRLLGVETSAIQSDPWGYAREAAKKFGQTVVLKTGHSVVAKPDGSLLVSPQAPPSLATAGSGDVLAGTIGGLMAQGLPAAAAAASALYIGSQAALIGEQEIGTLGIVASDLIDGIGLALRQIYDARW